MKNKFDVIVVGAGYIGSSVGYYLAKAGLSVLLIEQGSVANGASRANYGDIQVQDAELDYSLPMVKRGYACFEHLQDELGYDFHYRKRGSLLLIENESQWQAMKMRQKRLSEAGISTELVSSQRLKELEPLLETHLFKGALYYEDEAQVYPFSLITAFLSSASKHGLVLKLNTPVIDFCVDHSRITGVKTPEGIFEAPVVVLTTGAWTTPLGRKIGCDWTISHIHGQAVITEPAPNSLRNHLSSAAFFEEAHEGEVEETEQTAAKISFAIAQSVHDHILVGEISQPVKHFQTFTTPDAPVMLAENMARHFPLLKNLRILRGWASPVAFTDDGLPYLGKVGAIEGLILATAFRSTVIVTPLAGQVVTQLVCDGYSDLDISAFSPDR